MDKYSIIKKKKYSYICLNDGQHHCGECNNIPGYATFIDKVLNTNTKQIEKYENEKEW